MDNEKSINRFNFICRAQLQEKEKQRKAKESIFLEGIKRRQSMKKDKVGRVSSLSHRKVSCSSDRSSSEPGSEGMLKIHNKHEAAGNHK